MAIPRKKKLLQSIEPLSHNDRTRAVSTLARDNANSPELTSLLASLDEDLYQWQLRITMATAARRAEDVKTALTHPMPSVRRYAIRALRLVPVETDQVVELALQAVPADRRDLINVIASRGGPTVAEQLLTTMIARGHRSDAASLLPHCSSDVVDQRLAELDDAVVNWATLARAHPKPVLGFLREQMAVAPLLAEQWWSQASPAIIQLVDSNPDEILDLWQDFSNTGIPAPISVRLAWLFRRRPQRTLDLLLEREAAPARLLGQLARPSGRVDFETRARLAQAAFSQPPTLALILRYSPPSERGALFERAAQGHDRETLVVHQELLEILPRTMAATEARRMLQLRQFTDDPGATLNLLPRLPLDEVRDRLLEETRASDATIRGEGYRLLVEATMNSGDAANIDVLLDELQRLKNDQDPVRLAALGALSRAPARLFEHRHMLPISNLVTWTVEARDTSWATRAALTNLLQRVLASAATPERAQLIQPCVDALAAMAGTNGNVSLGQMERILPPGGETVLFDALAPQLRDDVRHERANLVFTLVTSLGRRAHKLPELQELLRQLTKANSQPVATAAIRWWLQPRGTKCERVGVILADDASAALLPGVFQLVALGRQDLIERCLSRQVRTGRFAARNGHKIPLVDSPFHGWTPDQRGHYARLLDRAITGEKVDWRAAAAARCLCRIPETSEAYLHKLLAHDSIPAVEAALSGMGRSEQPATALATLSSYAGTDRARVALYSATRAAKAAPPEVTVAAMAAILEAETSRLTSRKEAIRILGRVPSDAAMEVLANLWNRRPLHRDLNIALASALRSMPDHDLTWEVLTAMAAGTADEALAVVDAAQPLAWPARHRERLVALSTPMLDHPSHHVRNAAWGRALSWRPWSSKISDSARQAVTNLDTSDNLEQGVRAVLASVNGYPDDGLFPATIAELIRQPEPANSDAGAERDQPVRQRVRKLAAADPKSPDARAAVRTAAKHLIDSPRPLADEAVPLILASSDPTNPGEALDLLAELGARHPEIDPRLSYAIQQWCRPIVAKQGATQLLTEAERVAAIGTQTAKLVALGVLSDAGRQAGWPENARALLRRLRVDPEPWVGWYANNLMTARE